MKQLVGLEGTWNAANRRIIALDIETVSWDPDSKVGALSALSARIACICLLIEDGNDVAEVSLAQADEFELITEFWNSIKPTDVVVGHNIVAFDLQFIRQRSWILGIHPSRAFDLREYYTNDVVDTLEVWTNWGNKKGASLDAVSAALGCGSKTGNGMAVDRWWREGNLDAIKSYCREDVRLAYRVFCRLTYRQPKSFAPDTQTLCAGATPRSREGFCLGKVGELNVE